VVNEMKGELKRAGKKRAQRGRKAEDSFTL
jgi:hypothetical protein